MSRTIQVGTHSVTREASGLLFIRYVGDLSGYEMTAMYDAIELLSDGKKGVAALNDLTNIGEVSPGARRKVGEDPRSKVFGSVAVFGASFAVRVLSNMSTRAARTLGIGITAPIVFFKTESEARAWLDEILRKGD